MKPSKKDRSEIERILEANNLLSRSYTDLWDECSEYIKLELKHKDVNKPRDLVYRISFFHSDITCKAVGEKLLNIDESSWIWALPLGNRIESLCILMQPESPMHYDCPHLWALLKSIGMTDDKLTNILFEKYPGPFKNAHPLTKRVANVISPLYHSDAVIEGINGGGSKFDKSMYSLVSSICRNDRSSFLESFEMVSKGYKRTGFAQFIPGKYIPLILNGLWHLAINRQIVNSTTEWPIKWCDRSVMNQLNGELWMDGVPDILKQIPIVRLSIELESNNDEYYLEEMLKNYDSII